MHSQLTIMNIQLISLLHVVFVMTVIESIINIIINSTSDTEMKMAGTRG